MIRNYLSVAVRQLAKNKFYSIIHICGLSLGLATCIVIYQLVSFELGFDNFWNEKEKIHRITSRFSGTFEAVNKGVSTGVGTAVQDLSVFSATTPLHTVEGSVEVADLQVDRRVPYQGIQVAITSPIFFEIFQNWEWQEGPGRSVLTEPHQIALTERAALKFFGVSNASLIGKQVYFRDSLLLTISGILADPPTQSDFQFDGYISHATIAQSWLKGRIPKDNWSNTNSSSQVFVKLAPGVKLETAQSAMAEVKARFTAENPDISWQVDYQLQPLSNIHYDTEYGIFDSSRAAANKKTLWALAIIGMFLLLLACFNFINLETAKSALRAKEIGVRRVLGSPRAGIIVQLLSETSLLTLIALLLAAPLIFSAIPYFEEFLPPDFSIDFGQPHLVGFSLMLVLLVSLLSGIYPAWLATSVSPSIIVRNKGLPTLGSTGQGILRKVLIGSQFFLVQILILGSLIVYQQTRYAIQKDMGFSKESILHFNMPYGSSVEKKNEFQRLVKQLPGVDETSIFQAPPAHNGWSTSIMTYEKDGEELKLEVHRKPGDTSFINLFDIKLLAGRNIRADDGTNELVINQTLARQMGYEESTEALGEILKFSDQSVPIVGIVKDFHVLALHESMKPVAISYTNDGRLGVRVSATHWEDVSGMISQSELIWKEIWPEVDFSVAFMDETIENLYRQEIRTSKLIGTATGIALFIACLGLLGLVGFLGHQRTKEIGIRKVLGASTSQIVQIFTRDLIKWVIIAIVPASFVGIWIMNKWLDQFAYTFPFGWETVLFATLLCLFIAGATISLQSIRAAQVNPIDSLKED